MKIATQVYKMPEVGFQLILEEQNVIGINFLYKKKIILKERFEQAVKINSKEEECEWVEKMFRNAFLRK